jgi:hypothetical protein
VAAVGTEGPALGNTGEKHAVGSPLRCAHVQTAHDRLRWLAPRATLGSPSIENSIKFYASGCVFARTGNYLTWRCVAIQLGQQWIVMLLRECCAQCFTTATENASVERQLF